MLLPVRTACPAPNRTSRVATSISKTVEHECAIGNHVHKLTLEVFYFDHSSVVVPKHSSAGTVFYDIGGPVKLLIWVTLFASVVASSKTGLHLNDTISWS